MDAKMEFWHVAKTGKSAKLKFQTNINYCCEKLEIMKRDKLFVDFFHIQTGQTQHQSYDKIQWEQF